MFSQSEEKEENSKIEEDSQQQQKKSCDQTKKHLCIRKKVYVYTGIYLFIV